MRSFLPSRFKPSRHDELSVPEALAACLNEGDWRGLTPLAHAVQRRHNGLLRRLLALGADASVRDRLGRSCLHYAASLGNAAAIGITMHHMSASDPAGGGLARVARTLAAFIIIMSLCGYPI